MMKGKVQTNKSGVNVLVQTEASNNIHISSLDFPVELQVMSDDEIRQAYEQHIGSPSLQDMKDKLKKIEGFAISTCKAQNGEHDYGSLVKYQKQ